MRLRRGLAFVTLSLVLSAGCKTRSNNDSTSLETNNSGSSAAVAAALDGAVREASAFRSMTAGTDTSLLKKIGVDFSKLRGSWEFTVFPKISSAPEKTSANGTEFGAPVKFQFTVQRNVKCNALYKELTGTKKWNAVFFADLQENKTLECAIVSVVMKNDRVVNRMVDDIAEARVYIDSQFRAHGVDLDTYQADRRTIATQHIPFDTKESISSGLGVFPIDLPNLIAIASMATAGARETTTSTGALTLPKDPYVASKLNGSGVELCSGGTLIGYRDYYGAKNNVGWCSGTLWPTTIENQRYFAALTRKP